jgi:hypothetical protein
MKRRTAAAVILIIIFLVGILVTIKIATSNNEICTVFDGANYYPQPYQYPIFNASTCCTNFTVTYTPPVRSFGSEVTESESSGNIVTIISTGTIAFSGIPGDKWTETVCTYTG